MGYVDANLQTMKRSRPWSVLGFACDQKEDPRWHCIRKLVEKLGDYVEK
jgi:hypothetical protein